ncbi:MAG: hypothetical protein BGO62_10510 [Thiobacillus sp. 65-1402]|nr:MAG: hypothetical protein BGO62_10510 [Thiobacillus sp. 65-1402]
MAGRAMSQPERQAWALSYAMRARPTPELASRYFETLKRMLGDDPANNQNTGPATAEGTACRTRQIQQV